LLKGIGIVWNGFLDQTVRKNQVAIERGTKAESNIEEMNKEYEDKVKRTEELQERYSQLRKGVSITDSGIENISLSNEEYEEFLQINNELVSMYPSLRGGVDEYGNSIADMGSKSEEAAEKL